MRRCCSRSSPRSSRTSIRPASCRGSLSSAGSAASRRAPTSSCTAARASRPSRPTASAPPPASRRLAVPAGRAPPPWARQPSPGCRRRAHERLRRPQEPYFLQRLSASHTRHYFFNKQTNSGGACDFVSADGCAVCCIGGRGGRFFWGGWGRAAKPSFRRTSGRQNFRRPRFKDTIEAN